MDELRLPIALVVGVVCVAGCTSRAPSPELPEVAPARDRLERRSARLERIRSVMGRDLAKLEKLSRTFEGRDLEHRTDSFPVDLFKHVVVDCLNTPAIEVEEASRVGALDLDCRPRFVGRLESALEERDEAVREEAVELLRRVDRFHALRVRLRRRLGKVRAVLEDTRELVTEQRAELRKRRARWKKKKTEYRAKRWREVEAKFEAIDRQLDALESQATGLAGAVKSWPTRVDRANRRIYFSVTELGDEPRSAAEE